MALLRALVELGSQPVVLHVDHGLRGEESREDAEFVWELCSRLEVPYEVRRLKVEGGNLQDEARRGRYRIAEELAEAGGFSAIATGHTADDVAETVLMNLARGAGLRGLSGIPPVRGRVVRPLIEHRRQEILDYLAYLGQPYRTDRSNLAPKYARNRIRLEVLPVLEDLYPGAGANIARGAALLREDLEALEGLAVDVVQRRGDEAVLSARKLSGLRVAIQRYAIRQAYSALLPEAPPLGSSLVEAVLNLAQSDSGTRKLSLPGGITAVRTPEELTLYRRSEPPVDEGEVAVEAGSLVFAGWIFDVQEVSRFDAEDAARPEVAYLDAALGPYRVRLAREGDIIRPLGLGGTKKVFRAMMDRKVPKDQRRQTPVVVDGRGRVAWVFLGELDEEFKVGVGTEKALRLEVKRLP